jgi:hypothetical protein
VHIQTTTLLPPHVIVWAEIPDTKIATLEDLHPNAPSPLPGAQSRAIGDKWLKTEYSLALKVPSVLIPIDECNTLINPAHPDYNSLKTGPVTDLAVDPRLTDHNE